MGEVSPSEATASSLPSVESSRKDPQYFRNELMKMRNDPRQNPNHGRSMEDQEFWNEVGPKASSNVAWICCFEDFEAWQSSDCHMFP